MHAHTFLVVTMIACGTGCSATIEPGHRGLLFDPQKGGLQHEVLAPGVHRVGLSGRIEDFDITYSTRTETLHAITREALQVDLKLSIIYRPIVAELYELDTEIGPAYYDEVVGPELRAAARAAIARHSILELPSLNEKLEAEIEAETRERIARKHVEVSAITFESIQMPPELATAVRERLVAEQIAEKKRIETEKAWELEKIELMHDVERKRLKREAEGAR